MESLFKRLFRYRPREGYEPKEDWLTESFAAVLDCSRLREAYAGYLIGRRDVETADIETQRTFGRARPDMWIDARDAVGGRHVVMVEHKTGWEPAGARQLGDYERRLQRMTAKTKTLVQIARTPRKPDFEPADDVGFKSLPWFEICRWLQNRAATARSDGEAVEFVDELLKFMKERGMTIEISMDELAAYTVSKASGVEQRLWQILDAAWEDSGMEDAIGGSEGNWKRREPMRWVSPEISAHSVKIIYGFSFTRDDPEWDTDSLRLPSAYVGVWRTDESCKLPCPSGWKERPKAWREEYEWVCQIGELRLRGGSLTASYLEFFTDAFTALKAVLSARRKSVTTPSHSADTARHA